MPSNSFVHYFIENNKILSTHDLAIQRPMNPELLANPNFYVARSPMGWYFDVGSVMVGKRPQIGRYEVGNPSVISKPSPYKENGLFDCKQPHWTYLCK